MSFPLPEDFQSGSPLRDLVTAEIMKTIAGILNHMVVEEVAGLERAQIVKPAMPGRETPWRIQIPAVPQTEVELSASNPVADSGAGSPGSAGTAARGDHAHPLNVDTSTPAAVAASGSPGTSGKYARADHAHGGVTLNTETTPGADYEGGSIGTAGTAARADHRHRVNLTTTKPRPDVTNLDGSWQTGSDQSGSTGVSFAYSDRDHSHPTAALTAFNNIVPSATPRPVGSHLIPDLSDGDGQVSWAARLGYGPWYAPHDHVHPDRYPIAYGSPTVTFPGTIFVSGRTTTVAERTPETNSYYMRNAITWNIPIVTRSLINVKVVGGVTQTSIAHFTRVFTFDYSGRLCAVGPEARTGFYLG